MDVEGGNPFGGDDAENRPAVGRAGRGWDGNEKGVRPYGRFPLRRHIVRSGEAVASYDIARGARGPRGGAYEWGEWGARVLTYVKISRSSGWKMGLSAHMASVCEQMHTTV